MKIVDYTQNAGAIMQGIATLNARPGTPDGGQLLEGISEAALELRKREAERPVIIALTVGGEEHSTVTSDHVLDQLRRSAAALHVFSVERSALRSTVKPTNARDLLQENMHLNRVLGDGPKQTGGRHQSIVASAGFLAGLQNLATELLAQYRSTTRAPRRQTVRPAQRLDQAQGRDGARAGPAESVSPGAVSTPQPCNRRHARRRSVEDDVSGALRDRLRAGLSGAPSGRWLTRVRDRPESHCRLPKRAPAMRSTSVRTPALVILFAGMVCSAGCPSLIRQSAVDAIAAQIQPPDLVLVKQAGGVGESNGRGCHRLRAVAVHLCTAGPVDLAQRRDAEPYALDTASQALNPRTANAARGVTGDVEACWVGS